MEPEGSTCAITGNKLGEICVTTKEFSVAFTREAIDAIRSTLKTRMKTARPHEIDQIEDHLRMLDDGSRMKTTVPFTSITTVSIFPFNGSKEESLLGISVESEFAKINSINDDLLLFRLANPDANLIEQSFPKSIRRAKDLSGTGKLFRHGI